MYIRVICLTISLTMINFRSTYYSFLFDKNFILSTEQFFLSHD